MDDKGASISNGESASGSPLPLWLRMDSLFRVLVWETRYCSWTVMA